LLQAVENVGVLLLNGSQLLLAGAAVVTSITQFLRGVVVASVDQIEQNGPAGAVHGVRVLTQCHHGCAGALVRLDGAAARSVAQAADVLVEPSDFLLEPHDLGIQFLRPDQGLEVRVGRLVSARLRRGHRVLLRARGQRNERYEYCHDTGGSRDESQPCENPTWTMTSTATGQRIAPLSIALGAVTTSAKSAARTTLRV
jgi:hypothetical protein